jgi:regulator of sirC expression with transglutaminase-like and TPR domain
VNRGPNIKKLLEEVSALPEHRVDLARSALIVALWEYSDLDVSAYLRRLDDLGERLRISLEDVTSPEGKIHAINTLLFVEEGFRGNADDYYDARNSFLNEVLDRKTGIPITISIVYMEVGRRAGLPLYGIGLPGHFIVGLPNGNDRIFIDPFHGGKILTEDDCRELSQAYWTASRPFDRRFLEPVWPKQILVRLMRNLKAIYWQTESQDKAWQMIEWILIFDPDSIAELRERGLLREAIGDPSGAVADFTRYLQLAPESNDSELVRQRIEALKTEKTVIH